MAVADVAGIRFANQVAVVVVAVVRPSALRIVCRRQSPKRVVAELAMLRPLVNIGQVIHAVVIVRRRLADFSDARYATSGILADPSSTAWIIRVRGVGGFVVDRSTRAAVRVRELRRHGLLAGIDVTRFHTPARAIVLALGPTHRRIGRAAVWIGGALIAARGSDAASARAAGVAVDVLALRLDLFITKIS